MGIHILVDETLRRCLMNRNSLTMSLVFAGLLLAGIRVLAPHSVSAEFDRPKSFEFTVTFKDWECTVTHH